MPWRREETSARLFDQAHPPAWTMCHAGRTLPEFRAFRGKHSFWEVCRTPELVVEVTLQPPRRFPRDAAAASGR